MEFTVEELLTYARQHEADNWATLVRQVPFRYRVTDIGIEFIPTSGKRRTVLRRHLESFCEEFKQAGSFKPGDYPRRWNKSYSLPLLQRFLGTRGQDA